MLSIAKNACAGKPQGSNALHGAEGRRVAHACAWQGRSPTHRRRGHCGNTRLQTARAQRRNNRLRPPSHDGGRRIDG
ncbi:transcriptional regulator [Xanthomonas euvesicatoria]|nr:transcriptional regulator [Xanthomonas euvesicatoria pv. vesicatoria str. 85-10]APO89844.1 transcriptional regulator [Xanthomonas euvesicatoria]KHL61182.1 transcriptional regulator [Xanthomonas euvesicatoria]KHL66222.1 transcriptional regulator [Xanthomonas euvesicatoria]KLA54203.1 transcriptional regulator [Xanthomonas euvesicatoria]